MVPVQVEVEVSKQADHMVPGRHDERAALLPCPRSLLRAS